MTFERILWWAAGIVWIIFFGLTGILGLAEADIVKIGVSAIGLLCLAIAADVRVIRMTLDDPQD